MKGEDRAGEPASRRAGEKDGAGEPGSRRAGEKAKTQKETEEKASENALPDADRRTPEEKDEGGSQRASRPKKVWKTASDSILPGSVPPPGSPAPRLSGSHRGGSHVRSERHSEGGTHSATRIDALQSNLGHFFKDPYLLKQALTHPSAAVEEGRGRLASYERLEFLGDAVVGLNLALLLYDRFPQEDEGVLTRMRAYWASQVALAATARELGLESFLNLGAGEARDGGANRDRTLASALEGCFGALFLDGGPKAAAKLAKTLWAEPIRRRGLEVLAEDAKTALQEQRQAAVRPLPEYRTVPSGEGFTSSVVLDGEEAGHGEGNTRKAAEQAAARAALAASGMEKSEK